ncbi:MAG: hypothetical protein QM718_15100 [Steroidobacteraceae bacterium]
MSTSSGTVLRALLCGATLALTTSGAFSQGAAGNGQGQPPPAMPAAKTYETVAQINAGADVFKAWPSGGETWHHGVGFLDPFGSVEYFCGKEFPEAKNHPLPDWAAGLFKALTGRADPLFCIYRTKDGDFFVYDSVPGTLIRGDDYGRDLIFNVVIDGSGPYKGATGVWMGRTEGVGDSKQVSATRKGRSTLLKIMSGYVKIPG